MGKTVRNTISIPAELKARMHAVEEDVNWSAVASQAFEQKLAEIIQRKGVKDMGDVVARLRASKQAGETEQWTLGVGHGREYAKQAATAAELQRLERWRFSLSQDEWEWCFQEDSSAYAVCERFVFVIQPDTDGDRRQADEFWEAAVGNDHAALTEDPKYVLGFAAGALEVWGEVKDQL